MKVQIKYIEDDEMIFAHCLRDEISRIMPNVEVVILNPEGFEEKLEEKGSSAKLIEMILEKEE